MKVILSPWSKEVKKAMIDQDMDIKDIATHFKWTKQYVSKVINGHAYHRKAVESISYLFDIPVPSENATLAKNIEDSHYDKQFT